MQSKDYTALPQCVPVSDVDNVASCKRCASHPRGCNTVILLCMALITSVSANIFQFYQWGCDSQAKPCLSKYANLSRDMPTVRNYNSTFANPDRAISDAAWANLKLEVEDGWVALDDEYSESVGLPHSSRWPWHGHKGLYVFTSAHEMHCVIVLRTIINNVHDGDQAQYLHEHAMHCADVLRDTIMCNSDDYPLYNGPLNAQMGAKHPRAGVGTIKMCRDWDKLLAWARERSACWSEESREQPEDKFKRCPDGSKPWEHVNHIA